MKKKMKLEIIPVGNPAFPRYIIKNAAGEVFDGKKMAGNHSRAMVFVDGQDVAFAFNTLQEAQFEGYPLREFTVPLNVRVRAGEPFTKKQLEEYLERVTAILLDFGKASLVDDCMVQLGVTWAGLEETKPTAEKV